MSFQTQAIKYGWVALASLGIITGTTIYVANNQRKQVKPEDIIEIVLGVHERCLATQTATNPTYSVNPPSIVRTWTSNVYTTNGVTVYTNIVTNTIGFSLDRSMMVSLDATIKQLVPYYCDTNSVYDGSTQICMLTVTGLWASLQIGDKTNKFTRTPCWTNPVSTNWIVNYISYWPSTNGTATNIVYTSDYRQVVNYAKSWTATGGHVWVTSSNWASEVVTVTNAAAYGDYPWQIYTQDLEERYKVLNALKMTRTYKTAYNGSKADQGSDYPSIGYGGIDLYGWNFSNIVTHAISEKAYSFENSGFLDPHVYGISNAYYLNSNYFAGATNWVKLNGTGSGTNTLPDTKVIYNITWNEVKQFSTWWYFHYEKISPDQPPWTPYPDGYVYPTNLTGLGAGSYRAFYRAPNYAEETSPESGDFHTLMWAWPSSLLISFSTWRFQKDFAGQQITNTATLYIKPSLPVLPTNTTYWTENTYERPAQWDVNAVGQFGEFLGMTTGIYQILSENYIAENTNGTWTIEFGSDEFPPLSAMGAEPPFPIEPTPSSGFDDYDFNANSVGTIKGMYLYSEDYAFIKTWQFNYCTNKYW